MNTLDQFAAFLYRAQNVAFEETRDKIPTVYTDYTKSGDVSKADYRDVTGIKLGPLGYTAQGGQVHKDEYAPGTERVLKFKKLTTSVITPEELIDDMYNGNRVDKDKVKLFINMTKDFAESANWAYEIICNNFQQNGTSTTATSFWPGKGRDQLALFSTSHVTVKGTPVTWSNRQTVAPLNQVTLMEGVTMLEAIPDETGRPLGSVKNVTIVTGRYWEWRVPELIKTVNGQPDTPNNNPNAMHVRGVKWRHVLNPYLAATDATWMIQDDDVHQLTHFMKKKATYSKDIDIYTGNQINRCVTRFAIDFLTAKGVMSNQ